MNPLPLRLGPKDAEQLAFELGGEVAFLRASQGVFYARRLPWPPCSPVLRLLRGLYELEPRRARFIARNRIFSTVNASPGCAGAVRVAAHQLLAGVPAVDHGRSVAGGMPRLDAGAGVPPPQRAAPASEPALSAIVANAPAAAGDREWMGLAVLLRDEMRRQGGRLPPEVPVDKPVAALLVDEDGAFLDWATNTGSRNATSHAEVNLVEGWLRRGRRLLPPGCRVFTTLKPCKMCAGLVWDSAEAPGTLRVFYAEDDRLRYARETVLDARSMARRGVARDEAELRLLLQRQLAPAPQS